MAALGMLASDPESFRDWEASHRGDVSLDTDAAKNALGGIKSPTLHKATQIGSPPAGLAYDEFLAWWSDEIHAEWVEGAIVIMSPAGKRHRNLCDLLNTILRLFVQHQDAGEVISAPF